MKNKFFQIERDHFAKNAQGIRKTYHEKIFLMKILQTEPKLKDMNKIIMIYIILLLKIEMKRKL